MTNEDKAKKYAAVLKTLTELKNAEPAGMNKARVARIIKQLEIVIENSKEKN